MSETYLYVLIVINRASRAPYRDRTERGILVRVLARGALSARAGSRDGALLDQYRRLLIVTLLPEVGDALFRHDHVDFVLGVVDEGDDPRLPTAHLRRK